MGEGGKTEELDKRENLAKQRVERRKGVSCVDALYIFSRFRSDF
jgi:hypothetical protein